MNSVRYICGACGTNFDIPVNYVNRKVRCKCGKVNVATPSEVEEELEDLAELAPPPPPTFTTPMPQYAPPQYAPAPGYGGGYSAPGPRRQRSRRDENARPVLVTVFCILGFIGTGFLFLIWATAAYMFFTASKEVVDKLAKMPVNPYMVLAIFFAVILLLGLSYLMLWGRAKGGLFLLTGIYLVYGLLCLISLNICMVVATFIMFMIFVFPMYFALNDLE